MYEGLRGRARDFARRGSLKGGLLSCCVLLVGTVAACSDDGESGQTSSEVKATAVSHCPGTRRYDAFLQPGSTCQNVEATGGDWVAAPIFPDAPAKVRDISCAYYWRSSVNPPGPPEPQALQSLRARLLTANCAQPWCDSEECRMAGTGGASPMPAGVMASPGSGANGCDVCGIVSEDKLYIIVPEDFLGRYSVQLEEQNYLVLPDDRAQSYSVELPNQAMSYPEGFVTIY
jgi:hypothetical protein